MTMRSRTFDIAGALALALALTTAPARCERLTVPLSDPQHPATVKVSIIAGSVHVEGYAGKEVILETGDLDEEGPAMHKLNLDGTAAASASAAASAAGEERDEAEREKSKGMKRLPNRSMGLQVEEEKNVVRVVADSSRTPTDLRIQVPAATTIAIATVNDGDIRVGGVSGDMELQNTNGSIEVRDAVGAVVANTVNGDVKVVLTRVAGSRPMSFSSFNGDVDVTLPASAAADVRMSSENGDIYTDFDLEVSAKPPVVSQETRGGRHRIALEKEMRGRLGAGGPELQLKTFNGNIYIRKAK